MATIGRLNVEIAANVARLQRDMNSATNTIQRTTQSMTRMFKGVATAFAGMFSVRAIQGAINETLKMADATAKLSQQVGVSVEQLSSYQHAANLSGTSIQNVGNSLGRLSRNMLNAQRGTGEAQKSFEALGISVVDASGKLRASDAVMGDIADRFAQMEDGADKTAMAMEIFGRSGRELIPMLNQGRGGLEEMRKEADRLGLTMSTQMAQQAERVNDNFTRMRGGLKGLTIQIVDGVLPTLENLTNIFADFGDKQGEAKQASESLAAGLKLLASSGVLLSSIFQSLGRVIGGVAASISFLLERQFKKAWDALKMGGADAVSVMEEQWAKVEQIWDKSAEAALRVKESAEKTTPAVTNLGLEFEKTGEEASEAEKAFNKVRDSLKDQIKQVQLGEKEYARYSMLLEAGIDITGDLTKAEKERFAVLMELWAILQNVTEAQEYANEKAEAMVEIENLLANTMREINQLRGQGVDDIELQIWALMDLAVAYDLEYKAIEEVHQALLDLRKAREEAAIQSALDVALSFQTEEPEREINQFLESVERGMWDMSTVGLRALGTLEDTLVDTFMTGKFEARDMVDSILRDLVRLQIQQSIVQPLGNFMSGFSLFSAKGHAFDQGHVQAFAKGGIVNQPTVFPFARGVGLMGEAGPEAIMPLTRTSSGDLGVKAEGGGGKQDVRIHIHNESGQKMQVTDSKASFDAQGMIIDLWLDGFQRNKHGLRTALGG